MTSIYAQWALLGQTWADDVRVILTDGTISAVQTGAPVQGGDVSVAALVPALPNLHSHAFQRAMAGLTERRGTGADSFWSWRTAMYRMALAITPDQLEAVAAQLYMEMLEAGFARVGEFHYLHHDRDGTPYADPAELAARIAAASVETGIGLTLLPAFYAHGDFGGAAPLADQRRFIHAPDRYARLLERCRFLLTSVPGAVLGIAPHSLRAVSPDQLARILPLGTGGPIHLHIAEQTREVEACIAATGARPVEWLLQNAPVDGDWCLVHATHMTDAETRAVLASGAVAGLCPITEANLGDGIFPAAFLEAGGRFGVGSDSNVAISLPGELRQLEYSQRLATRRRNVVSAAGRSTGETLFARALAGGAQALGASGGIAVGNGADLVSLDLSAVPYLPRDAVIDHWIFAGGITVDRVWARGRLVVAGGRHRRRDAITARFKDAMATLAAPA